MASIKVADLLASRIFQCKQCRKRLSPPIMDVVDVGNLCGRCYNKNTYENAQENIEITKLLVKFTVPCNNYNLGCTFEGIYAETISHEAECYFREKICPFTSIDRCDCYTPLCYVPKHIKTEHLTDVHHYTSDTIKIEVSIEEEFEKFQLLVGGDKDYLLRIVSDNVCIYFLIYYYQHNNKTDFSIYHENEDFISKSKDCNAIPESKMDSAFDFSNATKFDLSSLRKCFSKKVSTVIKISYPSFEIANKNMLRFMECPVCNEYMTQQIRLCVQGHSICKPCRIKLQECPLCKSGFGNSRNFALESLSSLLHFPCKNTGCKLYIPGDSFEKHDLDCDFKIYQCPFLIKLNCKWKGLHNSITDHLLAEHSEYTELSNYVLRKVTLDYVSHKYDTICMVLGENIFKVCVCVNGSNKLFLTYGLYGPASAAKKFHWETGIYYKNTDEQKFIVTALCPTYTTTNFKLDIEGYGTEDVLHFYHKVTSNMSVGVGI